MSIRGRAAALALTTASAGLALPASTAHAATTCAVGVWKATYYANTKFSGTPKRTVCDTAINENYGTGAPAGLPKDYFGVRWTLTRDFGSGGPFTFTVAARDGVRVYLDGTRRINLWKDVSTTQTRKLNLTIPKGRHTIRVDYAAFKGSANVKFTYAPRTSASVDRTKPLAPSGLAASYSASTATAKLTWAKNAELDLAGYRVYRRVPDSSTWYEITGAPKLTGTSFSTYLAPTGQSCYYQIRAVDKAGNESAGSAARLVATVDKTPPPTPRPRVLSDNPLQGVSLGWDESEGGARYSVFRAASPTGPFMLLSAFAGNGWADSTAPFGETSYYKVSATDPAGNTSVSEVFSHERALAMPYMRDIKVNPEDNGGITLTWSVAPNAPDEFRLYREEYADNRQDPATTPVSCEARRVEHLPDDLRQYSCTDFTPVVGTDYSYVVTTVDPLGRESAPSPSSARVMYHDRTPPLPVSGLTVTPTPYGVVLEWQPSPASDVAAYVVHREPEPECGCSVGSVDANTTRFVDVGLPDGETYTYTVDAVDTSNNSLYTLYLNPRHLMPYVDVTELDLTPTVPTPPGSPLRLTATAAEFGDGVNLGWNAVAGATGYHVHRWNPDAAQYERITAEALPEDATAWTDPLAVTGTTHFYRVTAVYADGTESTPAAAYAILPPR